MVRDGGSCCSATSGKSNVLHNCFKQMINKWKHSYLYVVDKDYLRFWQHTPIPLLYFARSLKSKTGVHQVHTVQHMFYGTMALKTFTELALRAW